MEHAAKIFISEGCQAVTLPEDCHFDVETVFVRRDPQTGDVILSVKPSSWEPFFESLAQLEPGDMPDDFLMDRDPHVSSRNPFEDLA